MADRTNRRDLIIDTAGQLFMQQGYSSTSVRQIAEACEMTEAALYYHFKEGKRELLKTVVECQMPDLKSVLDGCRDAKSLSDLVHKYGSGMGQVAPQRITRLRWLMSEFPKFTLEERKLIYSKHIALHDGLAELMLPFVDDAEKASKLAWTLVVSGFGYGLLFWSFDLRSQVDFELEDFVETMTTLFSID